MHQGRNPAPNGENRNARSDGGLELEAPHEGTVQRTGAAEPASAHSNHAAKHGGLFFMAPDGWHHIEGVVTAEREFHLYFYNNLTKSISAQPFLEGTFIEIVKLDSEKKEMGRPVKVTFAKAEEHFLLASLPEGYPFPFEINARIKFEDHEKPVLFNFVFEHAAPGDLSKK